MRIVAFAALLSSIPIAASAQNPPPPNDPIVQVGLYGYRSDGSIGSSAHDTAPELSSIVYVNGQRCLMGAGNRPAPPDATDVWQFKGKVLSITPEQAVVQLDWRRTVAKGLRIDGNESSQQLSLRLGESLQLDQAGMESKPGCPTVAVGFEARYAPRFWGIPAGSSAGGGGGRVAASSGSGPATSNAGKAARGGSAGTSVAISQAGGEGGSLVSAAGSGLFDVSLWLVRVAPFRLDEVTHSQLRMNESGASFAFAPVQVTTSRGESLVVQVTGSLTVERDTNGEEQLVFRTLRRVSPSATGHAPRDVTLDSHGASRRIVNRMPGPEEVLSFELPPLNLNGKLVAPDQFSVRVKIAPRRQPGGSPDQ